MTHQIIYLNIYSEGVAKLHLRRRPAAPMRWGMHLFILADVESRKMKIPWINIEAPKGWKKNEPFRLRLSFFYYCYYYATCCSIYIVLSVPCVCKARSIASRSFLMTHFSVILINFGTSIRINQSSIKRETERGVICLWDMQKAMIICIEAREIQFWIWKEWMKLFINGVRLSLSTRF